MNKDQKRGLFHAMHMCVQRSLQCSLYCESSPRGQIEQVKAGCSMTVTGVCFKTCCEGGYSTRLLLRDLFLARSQQALMQPES